MVAWGSALAVTAMALFLSLAAGTTWAGVAPPQTAGGEAGGTVRLVFDASLRAAPFGVDRLAAALARAGLPSTWSADGGAADQQAAHVLVEHGRASEHEGSTEGSFQISRTGSVGEHQLRISGVGGAGAMYGALELAERIDRSRLGRGTGAPMSWAQLVDTLPLPLSVDARFEYRAIKFNLPFSAYRGGNATEQNYALCRNLTFWEAFLDQAAENRFNKLTLWALHPWPYMVTPTNFSGAVSYGDTAYWGGPPDGTDTEQDWKAFWTGLFKLAKDRAIDPYIVDWNVFLSEGFKTHYDSNAITDHDGSGGKGTVTEQSDSYQREVITQTINEYPDLAGIGLTIGERMVNLGEETRNLSAQVDWINDVVLAAITKANRPVNLIYRAALDSKAPTTVRDSIAKFVATMKARGASIKVWVQLKFNWSHGHSTPILVHAHGGGTGYEYWTPPSPAYKMAWMIRNEDFFFLRWGGSPFIRAHIARNGQDFVGGYATGSEGHIPAFDYATTRGSPTRTWDYDFERQWLYYMQWGRLLFDPTTPDQVFAAEYAKRAGLSDPKDGATMLEAMQSAAIMPLRLASFVYNTWDFTLHSEGFVQPTSHKKNSTSGFISIEVLISTKTLDPTLQTVMDFVKSGASSNASIVSPLQLAAELKTASSKALALLATVPDKPWLAAEKMDVETWAHLGAYFGLKLEAAVALQAFRTGGDALQQQAAVGKLVSAQQEWGSVVKITSSHLGQPELGGKIFLLDYGEGYSKPGMFSWAELSPLVAHDIEIARGSAAAAPRL